MSWVLGLSLGIKLKGLKVFTLNINFRVKVLKV
jgi:hypothetical protein